MRTPNPVTDGSYSLGLAKASAQRIHDLILPPPQMTIRHRVYIELDRLLARGSTWDAVRAAARHLDEKDAVRILLNQAIGQTNSKNIRSFIQEILRRDGIVPESESVNGEEPTPSLDDIKTLKEAAKRHELILVNYAALAVLENFPPEPAVADTEITTVAVHFVPVNDNFPYREPTLLVGRRTGEVGTHWNIDTGANTPGTLYAMSSYGDSGPYNTWPACIRSVLTDGYFLQLWLCTELTALFDSAPLASTDA